MKLSTFWLKNNICYNGSIRRIEKAKATLRKDFNLRLLGNLILLYFENSFYLIPELIKGFLYAATRKNSCGTILRKSAAALVAFVSFQGIVGIFKNVLSPMGKLAYYHIAILYYQGDYHMSEGLKTHVQEIIANKYAIYQASGLAGWLANQNFAFKIVAVFVACYLCILLARIIVDLCLHVVMQTQAPSKPKTKK